MEHVLDLFGVIADTTGFGRMAVDDAKALAEAAKVVAFERDQMVFDRGDEAKHLYIVAKGEVRLAVPGPDPTNAGENTLFGEIGLWPGKVHRRRAAAMATCPTILLQIRFNAFTAPMLKSMYEHLVALQAHYIERTGDLEQTEDEEPGGEDE